MTNESAESLLAEELNKLTFHEREAISEEIHGIGVGLSIDETPETLTDSFHRLQIEIDLLCSTDGGFGETAFALRRSQELFGSTHLNSEELRIMFLRRELFDCKKAAIRLCHYASLMYDLYGDIGLERRIKLSDIPDVEVEIMKLGYSQVCRDRDRAGRRIFIQFDSEFWSNLPEKTRLRINTYYTMSLMYSDVDTHKTGLVILFWLHNLKISIEGFYYKGLVSSRLSHAVPMRLSAAHFLFPHSNRNGSFAVAKWLTKMASAAKPHMRMHWASPMECFYILDSFGISPEQIPLDLGTGKMDTTNNTRWLKLCAAMEQNFELSKQIVDCPNASDILLGKGQFIMNHPGNKKFRNYVKSNLDLYASITSKKEATQWTLNVVSVMKNQYGARFLKEERVGKDLVAWVEVPNKTARLKVRIAFRDAVTRSGRSMEEQTDSKKSNDTSEVMLNDDVISSTPTELPLSRQKNARETAPYNSMSSLMSNQTAEKKRKLNGEFSSGRQQQREQHERQEPKHQASASDIRKLNDNLRELTSRLDTSTKLKEQQPSANDVRELNNNLRKLNGRLDKMKKIYQTLDSSTSAFLKFDDISSEKQCCSFNCF